MTVDPAVLKVADAVGALIEAWGFRRNMGRMWAVLYLEDHPLTAADLGDRLGLSTGAVSMLVNELVQWGIIKKTWVVGERREHFEAETSIWKMISRVFRERELRWIRTAHEAFAEAGRELEAGEQSEPGGGDPAGSAGGAGGNAPRGIDDTRHQLIAGRVAGLTQLAQVGAHLLETMLQGEAVDSLPIKQLGELAAIARPPTDPDKP
ncbi:MAG TPA: MarR family transcriptional regulator [Kofleriaceae bacterium]|jgi:DNA-binding transcriptional regulator GbsR (MarR family)|nr:MarR family transcriptional regulator [Kofleriaceae bacterium]